MKIGSKLKKIIAAITALMIAAAGYLPSFAAQEEYDAANATYFTFSDAGITVSGGSGAGYEIDGTSLEITASGTYAVSGSCADGAITVKKNVVDVVLVLNGLELTSADTAPLSCGKSSGVVIIAASGSENTLADNEYNNDDIYVENTAAENAVIKCKDGSKVTICGSGVLNIDSHGKNGIKSGLSTETEGEAWIAIRDLTLNVAAAVNDGINAEQLLNIESGNITVDAADDGIHCDYVMNIGSENSQGPVINVANSNEGIEAANLNVFSGNINVHSYDDCMNAANSDLIGYAFTLNISGGNLYMFGETGDGIDSNGSITISGGHTEVWTKSTADNQPLDADGTITLSGGTVLAAGGSSGMGLNLNAQQPYVIYGRSGMGFGPGFGGRPGFGQPGQPGGSQTNIQLNAGSEFEIHDSANNTIYSGTTACNTVYMFFSTGELVSGDTYALYANGSSVAEAAAQGSGGGSVPQPPVDPSQPPVDPSQPPANPSQPPVDPSQPPANPSQPPVDPSQPPANPSQPPVDPSQPPVDPSQPPVDPSQPPVDPPQDMYLVTFVDWDGRILKSEMVPAGGNAAPPEAPQRTNWVFSGWNGRYTNITNDTTVTAEYTMLGDIDMNGSVNAEDALLILRIAMGLTSVTEQQAVLADVDTNSVTEISDAVTIMRFALGIVSIAY